MFNTQIRFVVRGGGGGTGDAGEGREFVGSNLAVDARQLAHESALAN